MRYASFTSNHRPVIKRSSATPRPTMCGSRWVSPDSAPTFQRRFTTPKFAWSAAIRMSHAIASSIRSEEHTSELQSQSKLVCRLLLEKKKKKHTIYRYLTSLNMKVVHER